MYYPKRRSIKASSYNRCWDVCVIFVSITMLSSSMNLISSKSTTCRRFLVQAFTTPRRTVARTTISAASTRISSTPAVSNSHFLYRTLTTSRGVANIDEDLDAALDELLGSPFDEEDAYVKTATTKRNGDKLAVNHIEGSKPVPQNLVEEVRRNQNQ